VNGGFGTGGTTFVAKGFSVPTAGQCTPLSAFAKTATTVILKSTGSACFSINSKVLTVSIFSTDPAFLGAGQLGADYIQLCPAGGTCPVPEEDQGAFSGPVELVTCTNKVLSLPPMHD